jgi:hypothetical protein
MSAEYTIYLLINLLALGLAAALVGLKRLFSPTRLAGMFLLVFAATYLVRPLFTSLSGDLKTWALYRISGFEANPWPLTWAVCLALVCFGLGYRLGSCFSRWIRPGPAPWNLWGRNYPWLIYGALFLFLLYGYVSFALTGSSAEMTATTGGGIFVGTTGYLVRGDIYIGAALLLLYAATNRLSLTIVLALPWLLGRLLVGWSRATFVFFLLGLLLIWIWTGQRKKFSLRKGILLISLMAPAVLSFSLIQQQRDYFTATAVDPDRLIEDTLREEIYLSWIRSDSPIAGFEATVFLLQTLRSFDYGLGYVYYIFLQPIPRILWPGKPTAASMVPWVNSFFGYTTPADPGEAYDAERGILPEFYGSAPGAVGDGYKQGSWAGIVLVFLLSGLLLRGLEETFERSSQSPAVVMGYASCFAVLVQCGRESVIYLISVWLFNYGAVFLIAYLCESWTTSRRMRI